MNNKSKSLNADALFEEANRLWYEKGFTQKALMLYRQFLNRSPDHPAGLLQLARTLWSVGSFEESQRLLERLEGRQHTLTADGQDLLELTKEQIANRPSTRELIDMESSLLDMERLEEEQFSSDMWVRIGLAAKAWRIYGVALRALKRGNGTVRHLVREISEIERRLSIDRSLLKKMTTK